MSMILYLRRADRSQLDALRSSLASPQTTAAPLIKTGLLSKLFARQTPSSAINVDTDNLVQEFLFKDTPAADLVDFDRAWDVLNMMLTGEPFGVSGPLALFYFQGEEIGSDCGYGPARYVPAEVVKTFARALRGLSDHELASRFDPVAFQAAQLYSANLFSEDGVEVDYIMQGVPKLRRFADHCVETSSGALVAIY